MNSTNVIFCILSFINHCISFKLKGASEWKNKWSKLRYVYRRKVNTNKGNDSVVLNAMEFLRPYISENNAVYKARAKKAREAKIIRMAQLTASQSNAYNQAHAVNLNPCNTFISEYFQMENNIFAELERRAGIRFDSY